MLTFSLKHRQSDPRLSQYMTERKQRRSRYGARWKGLLQFVLRGMLSGRCNLDLLLDPVCLHCPRPQEARRWLPGLGSSSDPVDLIEALRLANAINPWRNQFRDVIDDHPGYSIGRLRGKFFPACNLLINFFIRSSTHLAWSR